jgi:competence protein ComEC
MINFKSTPFFKILLPYLTGILFILKFGFFQNLHFFFLASFLLWVFSFVLQTQQHTLHSFKKVFYILCTNLLLCVLALESCFLYDARNNSHHYSHYTSSQPQKFFVTIDDIPVTTEKFIKIPIQINCIEQNNQWHYTEGNSIVYLKNDSSLQLELGNHLLLNSLFSYVNEPKNPYEFDYKTFLENKNIFHVVYAKSKQVTIVSTKNYGFSFAKLGAKIKGHLVSVLRNSHLSQHAFSIGSALLVGYDDEIDSEVMQRFSHSGTLHILSVSGMHTGVLYGILLFIFSVFDKYERYKKTKFVFVMFFLLLFIFITGLSPSVLRAALMLSLVLFGKTFYKQGNGYNTLLLSAFLLLLFNPYLIQDVGFLLSYLAVFGIMYLYPVLARLYSFENKILQWLWTSVLISIAATLFTLPISLYFFHQFPLWFVFSNLLIIPISMFLMLGAALFLMLHKVIVLNHLLVYIINVSTSIMLWLAQLTDNPHYGFIDFICFSKMDVWFLSAVIFMCLLIIAGKQYKQVVALCCMIVVWLSVSIYDSIAQKEKTEFVVFYVKQKSAYALRVGETVYVNFEELNEKEFQRHVKPYLLTVSNLKVVATKANVLRINTKCIVNTYLLDSLPTTEHPEYVLVSHDAPFELTTNYKTKPLVIADCSNSYKFVKQLKKQCALLEIPFYWVKENGAIQITL